MADAPFPTRPKWTSLRFCGGEGELMETRKETAPKMQLILFSKSVYLLLYFLFRSFKIKLHIVAVSGISWVN